MTTLNVPLGILPILGGAQIAGAAGLIIGVWYGPVGIAAAVGLMLYFIGAVGAHLRAKDAKGTIPAAILAIISILLTALRATSL